MQNLQYEQVRYANGFVLVSTTFSYGLRSKCADLPNSYKSITSTICMYVQISRQFLEVLSVYNIFRHLSTLKLCFFIKFYSFLSDGLFFTANVILSFLTPA